MVTILISSRHRNKGSVIHGTKPNNIRTPGDGWVVTFGHGHDDGATMISTHAAPARSYCPLPPSIHCPLPRAPCVQYRPECTVVGIRIQRAGYGQRKREEAAPGGLEMFLAEMGAFDRQGSLTEPWIYLRWAHLSWSEPWWGPFSSFYFSPNLGVDWNCTLTGLNLTLSWQFEFHF